MDNDMRLIDANNMKRHLQTLIAEYNSMGDVDSNINATLAQFAVDIIDNAPTVEVVPAERRCRMNNNLISRSDIKDHISELMLVYSGAELDNVILNAIDNAPIVEPQGEWVRKEDVIQSIAKQYSEHNELVPMWLSIGDIKGGAE